MFYYNYTELPASKKQSKKIKTLVLQYSSFSHLGMMMIGDSQDQVPIAGFLHSVTP